MLSIYANDIVIGLQLQQPHRVIQKRQVEKIVYQIENSDKPREN